MLDALFVLIAVCLTALAWQNALAERERARRLSATLCAEAGVQLLDQTVALRRIGFARNRQGSFSLRRWYSFDVSTDGSDRLRGGVQMLSGVVESYSLPERREAI